MADCLNGLDRAAALAFLGRGVRAQDVGEALLDNCLNQVRDAARPRAVWRRFSLVPREDMIYLEPGKIALPGRSARLLLDGCDQAALMAVTLGAQVDARIDRAQLRSMREALTLDGCASAAVECAADYYQSALEAELARENLFLTRRFSPGYGDMPLSLQADFLRALDAQRAAGLYLTPSLMLRPVKSVTAVMGVARSPRPRCANRCDLCDMKGRCAFSQP